MEPACAAALEHELKHIQNVFSELNDYPPFKLVETTIKDERNNFQQNESMLEMDEKEPGDEGEKVVSKMRKSISNTVKHPSLDHDSTSRIR